MYEDVDAAIEMLRPILRGTRCCIQAGGHVGHWPVRLSSVFESVVTFEPEPGNFQELESATKFIGSIQAYNAALGKYNGVAHMERTAGETANDNRGAYFMRPGGSIPIMTIDSLDLKPDLIYLDIEGAEYMALEGAVDTIRRCKPVIGVEDKGHHERYGSKRIERLLVDIYGYSSIGRPFKSDQIFVI